MKKTSRIILSLICAVAASALLSVTGSAADVLRGDINGDGKISVIDYIEMRRAILNGTSLSSDTADINGDGKINSSDYVAIRLHILGIKQIVQPVPEQTGKFVRTAVSAGCKYTITGGNIGERYEDSYNMELTDGSYANPGTTDYFDTHFVGISGAKPGRITVDLGKAYDNINGFEFSFLSVDTAGIRPPSSIKVYISEDNTQWKLAGSMALNTSPVNNTDKALLNVTNQLKARFVRFDFTSSLAWVFVDEVSVFADMPEKDLYSVAEKISEFYANDISDSDKQGNISMFKSTTALDLEKTAVSVSDGKKYTVSNAKYALDVMSDSGKALTDGNSGNSFEDGTWVAYTADEEHVITLDLGSVVNDISSVSLSSYAKTNGGIYLPVYVDISLSTDNKNFHRIARLYSPTGDIDGKYDFEFNPGYCLKTRYIRFTVGESNGKFTLVSEVAAAANRGEESVFYPPVKIDTEDSGAWASPTTTVKNLLYGKYPQIQPYLNINSLIDPEANTPVTSKLLTDGKNASSDYCYDGTWFHCLGASGRHIYFDLGHVSALKYVSGGTLHNPGWAIYSPKMTVRLSEDGVNWYVAGTYTPPTGTYSRRNAFKISFGKTYKARYVCFDIPFVGHLFIDEISAYGCTSLDNAIGLADSGLEPYKPSSQEGEAFYQAPSPDLLKGVNDVVLAYYNNATLTESFFLPYAGYIVNGKPVDTMFDSFLFLPNPSALKNGGTADGQSDMEEWMDLEDKLFIEGQNLDALNKAAEKVKSELGLDDYKYKFFVSIAHPSMYMTNFGDFNGDGKTESLASVNNRINAVKWYVERFYKLYDPAKYPNLEFAGWYWFHESIDTNYGDPQVIKGVSDYLHSIGDQLFWIPYFTAEGYTTWKDVGFDVCCMQPNYAFDAKVGSSRLKDAANLIKINNMCIEIEIDGRALTDEVFFKKYLGYLSGGITYGYMNEAIHMYYEAGGFFYNASDPSSTGRPLYDATYRFIKKTLAGGPEAPATVTIKTAVNTPLSHKVYDVGNAIEVALTSQPSHGTVSVNRDGTVTYYPNKGYTGTDTFRVAAYDYIGYSPEAEITVKVG